MNHQIEHISDYINVSVSRLREEKTKEIVLFFLLCVAINLIGGIDISSRRLLYLDMLGTALAGIALGPWWGASVGLVTNFMLYLMLPTSPSLLVFALVNVLGGLYWGYMCNLKILRPIEGITSIQKIFNFNELKKAVWFVLASGGVALSIPVIILLRFVLGFISSDTNIDRYIFYVVNNVTDKLLCVVIATVIICCFFPALASHLGSDKPQISYGVSLRSIAWFSGLYSVPFLIYLHLYLQHWYIWVIPYVLAFIALFKIGAEHYQSQRVSINLSFITYGALFWLVLSSIASFAQYVYFAVNHVSPKFDIYYVNGVLQVKNMIADAFSLSLVVALIGVVFAVLIQAIKQREDREILRRVEATKDKIATDIHNDPLQLVSVLRRKISTLENNICIIKEAINEIREKPDQKVEIDILEKKVNELSKTFTNYYEAYLPELDTSIRKIIKPLSDKDTMIIGKIGFIQKLKDLIDEFCTRNKGFTLKFNTEITEKDLPSRRSDGDLWKVELIKVIREILNNAEKHSQGDKLYIDLSIPKIKGKKKFIVSIIDNGIGFNPKIDQINPDSFGFYEIKTRTKDIGATINIDYNKPLATENKGTKILIEIPYDY